jgi:hypothetical protein
VERYAPVLELHKVEDVSRARNEEDLHDRVVRRDIAEEEVKIAG